ncbi:hypothetical protein C8R46DRAFT_1071797, partial [Mycena filopes]
MSFPSFTTRYRFVYALSLLQVVAGVATVWLYGLVGGVAAAIIQLTPPAYALGTAVLIHRMLPYTTRKTDTPTNLSRVDVHYHNLIFTCFMWVLCFVNTRDFDFYGLPKYEASSKALALCAQSASSIDSWKCIPPGMDAVLPIAIVVALFSTCRALKRRATALYGTEFKLVAAPPLESSDQSSDSTAETKLIPAWMAVQVADVAREGPEARDSVMLLPVSKS